jgi:hypothetical protein
LYKSPLHILSGFDSDVTELSKPDFLLRLRKKLLAEFNLSNSATIDINGVAYSKDEIIKTIDVLMGNPQMPMHSFVFANKNLLIFLENDNSTITPFQLKDIVIPEEVKPLLGPLMLERLSINLKKAFHSRNFDRAFDMIVYLPQLPEEEKLTLEEEINKNLVNIEEHIEYVRSSGYKNLTLELAYLKKDSFATLLNKLPSDFFYTINSLVSEIINTMVFYQKMRGHDEAFLYDLSINLCRIKCDEELMKLIRSNHAAFSQNYKGRSESNDGSFFSGRGVYIIIVVVIFLIRIATTCGTNSSSSRTKYDFEKYDIDKYKIDNLDNNKIDLGEIHNSNVSGSKEFERYRAHIINTTSDANYIGLMDYEKPKSGNNPFLFTVKGTTFYDYMIPDLKRVIINNATDHDLIITVFGRYETRAYIFYKNQPDTLGFKENDRMCLYFGDTLVYRGAEASNPKAAAYGWFFEAFFKNTDDQSRSIFKNNYTIEFKSKKKRKIKSSLPVIKFTKSFFDKRVFKSEKIDMFVSDTFDTSGFLEFF